MEARLNLSRKIEAFEQKHPIHLSLDQLIRRIKAFEKKRKEAGTSIEVENFDQHLENILQLHQ